MQNTLAGYARQGSIVHYLDLTTVLNDIKANPGGYGIQGLVCPAIPDPTCIANSSAPFLFYVDNLHLTSVGFAIVGKYIAVQLAAPLTLQAPSDMGLDVAQQWGRTLSSRSDLYGRGGEKDGLHFYVLGDALSHDVRATSTNDEFEVRSWGGTVGAEYGVPGGMIGIAGNYSRPKTSFGTNTADERGHSWQVGAYGSMEAGGLFGQAYVGYGKDSDRITRQGVVEGMEAHPHGNHTLAGAKGGYLMSFAGLRAGPIVAVDYARAKVDGYTESGDPALTLNVSGQHAKAFTGQAGIEVRGDLAGLHPFVDLTAERNFTNNDRLITFAQTDAPGIVNSWAVPGRKQTYGRLAGGASATLNSALSVDAFVSTTLSHKGGNVTGGNVGVKVRF
jgi:outer membrane lipase/esterase